MTGNRKPKALLRNSKEIPQFAPNFTVYVQSPNVVCLYSDDRKFFLHGALYCAVASAIAEGKSSFQQIARKLDLKFPHDTVDEAFKRLVDRRYILPKSRFSAGPVAAYWASLGLSPEI